MKKTDIIIHIVAWSLFVLGVFWILIALVTNVFYTVLGVIFVIIAFLLEFLMNTVELKKS